MSTSAIELRWDQGQSNWKRHQRRFVRPIITEALEHAMAGAAAVDIMSQLESILLSRGTNTNKQYGFNNLVDGTVELYLPAKDIRHRKLANQHGLWTQVIFHENTHYARTGYYREFTLLELAASEGLAYCATQLFAARVGMRDEFGVPVDFLRTLPKTDLSAIRDQVLDAHEAIGVMSLDEIGEGSSFNYWVRTPEVGVYSATEVVGICAVADLIDRGHNIGELISVPAAELLSV
jgi:hypothetical protein